MATNSISSPSAGYHPPKCKVIWVSLAMLAWLHLAVASKLRAQESGVSLKLDLVAWGDVITDLSLKSKVSDHTITAQPFTYSNPVNYSGPPILEIYQNAGSSEKTDGQTPKHEGQPTAVAPKTAQATANPAQPQTALSLELERRRKDNPNLVALARIPTACSRATVLLAPSAGGTFDAYVLNDDPTKLPIGKLRVLNLSPFPIAMRFQVKPPVTKEFKTNDSIVVPATREHVIYELAYKQDNEWKFQENNIIKVRPNEQTQMIVLRSMNSFFLSSDGSTGSFLQVVTLRRDPK